MNIGIIGAGAAGLTAGYDLAKLGHKVQIFEEAPFIGGQASTFQVGAGQLERGYHHLFMSDKDMIGLIDDLGLSKELAWIESSVGLFHSGQIWNFASPIDLLKFRPLSLMQRFKVGIWSLLLQKTANWEKYEHVTAKEWITAHMGKDAYRVIWEPLLRGKFGQYHDQISMTWLWGKFRLRVSSRQSIFSNEKLGYPLCSFGTVFDRLGEQIVLLNGQIQVKTRVQEIIISNGRAVGLRVTKNGNEDNLTFDSVIATTPSYVFSRLAPNLPEFYIEQLHSTQYLAAVVLILELDHPLSSKYWMNIADLDFPFVGIIEHTNLVDPELYSGNHLVYLTNYPDINSDIYNMSKEELLNTYLPHLNKINPDFDPSWVRNSHYHKINGAQPVVGVNYSSNIPSHRTPFQNLYLANTTQIYPEDRGTNYSVKMGHLVARLVQEDFSRII